MRKYLIASIKLTFLLIILCAGLYPLLIAAISKMANGRGDGQTIKVNGQVVGYANIGQKFTEEKYFWGRPSAANYNAAASSASNKGATNPDYLKQVKDLIDTFLVHNPGIKKEQIPADMVTASGSGLDPDISPEGAYIQIKRVAKWRGVDDMKIKHLVDQQVDKGMLGPDKVNVLKLNVALDQLK